MRQKQPGGAFDDVLFEEDAAQTVVDFAQSGFRPVIVVDTFSGDKVEAFLARAKSLNCNLTYRLYGLHAKPEVLSRRLSSRPAGCFSDLTISLKLNEDLLKIRLPEETTVDTTNLTAAELAAEMA